MLILQYSSLHTHVLHQEYNEYIVFGFDRKNRMTDTAVVPTGGQTTRTNISVNSPGRVKTLNNTLDKNVKTSIKLKPYHQS